MKRNESGWSSTEISVTNPITLSDCQSNIRTDQMEQINEHKTRFRGNERTVPLVQM